ncbi:MAG: fumarylacetoacetate hydrolase family protein [Rhodothermaceae bacterium]|nr:fumarylacetoacetate hydrolase family protein [Bacteroidota bacterium]MXX97797.1 fumarylacetoacetate hydrolase family protein [Rhodothermaceae bacterium]MXZ57271.1 fumarylacetoacetate hydrolase family protein [Rhodothermaceae bacterium]MYB91615.1 fumarylacetoacetate hydrolase family protein [Rhodothermaceae bacterium]MYD68050.1 fumarylacetoacetate hydrolase family protein [Rhodothermaceae bacterium]
MKLIRIGPDGQEKPGLLPEDGRRIDTTPVVDDYDEHFFEQGGLGRLQAWFDADTPKQELDPDSRMGPPIARPSKIVCVGLNYALHAKESGMDPPPEPVLFFKASSAICGPYDDLIIPGNKTDWEVELAVVIGKRASYVTAEQAPNYIAGYVLHNDYSERESQLERGGQWVKGKSFDTFAPLGPFLATADEIPDPNNLKLWLSVNGTMLQNSTTADFIFDVWEVISYTSHFMTLLPGDVISTGTPAGVGLGLNPQRYLKPGDVVELGIEGLGEARQVARARHL